jgi:hypothetical protein
MLIATKEVAIVLSTGLHHQKYLSLGLRTLVGDKGELD